MGNVAVTFNTDEHIKNSFEQVCANLGINPSAGFNVLMKAAILERNLLLEETNSFGMNKANYQQQQRKAAYEFIDTVNSVQGELNTQDYVEFESGKFKAKFNKKELDL